MGKVTIPSGKVRKDAKDYGKVSPIHKPGTKGIPAQSLYANATPSQDKALNLKEM